MKSNEVKNFTESKIRCIIPRQMARPPTITRDDLIPLIRARGPISATELGALLRVDRTTIGRTLRDFGDELVTLGATRSTRYLLRRNVRDIGNRWPLYRIDEAGRASEWAELEALQDRRWRLQWAGSAPAWAGHFTEDYGLLSGLPFFLQDVRPQGFLGRTIARQFARALQVPDDPRRWEDEDALIYLHAEGRDLPGDVVVGDRCLREALAMVAGTWETRLVPEASPESAYVEMSASITEDAPGSSAGGEQPKFIARLEAESGATRQVIVKFSPPVDQPVGERWADLLLCEFHAQAVLASAGLVLSGARIFNAGGRRFLEVPRFDRAGDGGRRGVVTMEALTTAAVGALPRDWPSGAGELLRVGLLASESVRTVHLLHAFGELIGNTDMHAENVAFFLGDELPLRPTPAYDMLPMHWAPGPLGEIVERRFAPEPPVPSMTELWREAAALAAEFWQRVIDDPRLSPSRADAARQAHEILGRLRQHVG